MSVPPTDPKVLATLTLHMVELDALVGLLTKLGLTTHAAHDCATAAALGRITEAALAAQHESTPEAALARFTDAVRAVPS